VTILATEDFDPECDWAHVELNRRDLNTALNAYIRHVREPTLVVMSDIPAHPRVARARDVLGGRLRSSRGRGGGTNAIFHARPLPLQGRFFTK